MDVHRFFLEIKTKLKLNLNGISMRQYLKILFKISICPNFLKFWRAALRFYTLVHILRKYSATGPRHFWSFSKSRISNGKFCSREGKSPFEGGTYDRPNWVLFSGNFPSYGSAFARKIPSHGCQSLSLSPRRGS